MKARTTIQDFKELGREETLSLILSPEAKHIPPEILFALMSSNPEDIIGSVVFSKSKDVSVVCIYHAKDAIPVMLEIGVNLQMKGLSMDAFQIRNVNLSALERTQSETGFLNRISEDFDPSSN